MTPTFAAIDRLERERTEWRPWLGVIREVLREADHRCWDAAVPPNMWHRVPGLPAIACTLDTVPASAVEPWTARLLRTASRAGTPAMASLGTAARHVDPEQLFGAALCQDDGAVREIAGGANADPDALQSVAALLPVPFLLACHRAAGHSHGQAWVERYCPTCGAWPAFVEVRGIERSRYCRCGRCGGEWHALALSCPYCRTDDHDALVSLVPQEGGAAATIDACTICGGYVKTFTRLQGCEPALVLVEDLASVHLDMSALDQGYHRPSGAGFMWETVRT